MSWSPDELVQWAACDLALGEIMGVNDVRDVSSNWFLGYRFQIRPRLDFELELMGQWVFAKVLVEEGSDCVLFEIHPSPYNNRPRMLRVPFAEPGFHASFKVKYFEWDNGDSSLVPWESSTKIIHDIDG